MPCDKEFLEACLLGARIGRFLGMSEKEIRKMHTNMIYRQIEVDAVDEGRACRASWIDEHWKDKPLAQGKGGTNCPGFFSEACQRGELNDQL